MHLDKLLILRQIAILFPGFERYFSAGFIIFARLLGFIRFAPVLNRKEINATVYGYMNDEYSQSSNGNQIVKLKVDTNREDLQKSVTQILSNDISRKYKKSATISNKFIIDSILKNHKNDTVNENDYDSDKYGASLITKNIKAHEVKLYHDFIK